MQSVRVLTPATNAKREPYKYFYAVPSHLEVAVVYMHRTFAMQQPQHL